MLSLLRFCLAVAVPLAENPEQPTAAEEEAYFGDAIRSTKAWFHRRHGTSDDDIFDDDDDDIKQGPTGQWSWTSNFSYGGKPAKKTTPAERKVGQPAIIADHAVLANIHPSVRPSVQAHHCTRAHTAPCDNKLETRFVWPSANVASC